MSYGKITRPGQPEQPTNPQIGLSFEDALRHVKQGRKLSRHGWNGKGMYIYMIPERSMTVGETDETEALVPFRGDGVQVTYAARVDMQYCDGRIGVWTPTMDDLLADDWNLLV